LDSHLIVELVLVATILVGRAGDVFSTHFASPDLVLEANALVKRIGWPWAIASFLLAVVPFFSIEFGVMVAVPSLFVASSNLFEGWVAHALGERQYFELLQHAASKLAPRIAYASVLGSAAFVVLASGLLLFISGGSEHPSWYFAWGLLAYAAALGVHGTTFVRRLYDGLASSEASSPAGSSEQAHPSDSAHDR
jgi:hypothetical protein